MILRNGDRSNADTWSNILRRVVFDDRSLITALNKKVNLLFGTLRIQAVTIKNNGRVCFSLHRISTRIVLIRCNCSNVFVFSSLHNRQTRNIGVYSFNQTQLFQLIYSSLMAAICFAPRRVKLAVNHKNQNIVLTNLVLTYLFVCF